MALVAKGLTNAEIAARFGTATDTVRQQRLDALHKVNARNSAHAVALLGIAA